MTKIVCSAVDCKYCGKDWICNKKIIHLPSHNVATVYQGRKEFLSCKEYEKDDFMKAIEKLVENTTEAKITMN